MFSDESRYFPNEVVKAHALFGKTLLGAWREYFGLTQKEMAKRMGIRIAVYAQIEQSTANHEDTMKKAALALGLERRLLTLEEDE